MKQFLKARSLRAVMMTLLAAFLLAVPSQSHAGVFVQVGIAPPIMPIYAQPICPGDGYMWTPGYWGYGGDGYYWVPGTWVLAPQPGLLWTPGYWGWGNGFYMWHGGYWGTHIGFYGGVNYGFGFFGTGFYGGRWEGGHFLYNSAYAHVGPGFHGTYVNRVNIANNSRVAFNGGSGGIQAHENAEEHAAANEHHIEATHAQQVHADAASHDHGNFASANHGNPAHAATDRPATGANDFHNSTAARGNENAGAHNNAAQNHPNTAQNHSTTNQNHNTNNNQNHSTGNNTQSHASAGGGRPAPHAAPRGGGNRK
jgi:hypothetical protein